MFYIYIGSESPTCHCWASPMSVNAAILLRWVRGATTMPFIGQFFSSNPYATQLP